MDATTYNEIMDAVDHIDAMAGELGDDDVAETVSGLCNAIRHEIERVNA